MRSLRPLLVTFTLTMLLSPIGYHGSLGSRALGLSPTTAASPLLEDIPMFRMDARRSSIEPGPGPIGTPTIAWSLDLDTPPSTLPILVAGQIIVGDQGGDLVALDARTGAARWRATGDGALSGTPASADGIVIVADTTGIMAVDALTGTQRWRRDVLTEAPRLVIDGGVVYLGTTDGAVKGLDISTGADRWSWQGTHGLSVRVDAVADGLVFANPNDGQVIAINLADGTEHWRVSSQVSRLSYEVAGDTFYLYNPVADSNQPLGAISAVDIASGRVRWRFAPPSGNQTTAGPVQDGVMYVNTVSDGLYALADHGDTYDVVWHIDFAQVNFPMALSGGVLYGIDENGAPFAVRAADGSVIWHGDDTGVYGLPLVSGGMILTAANPGGNPVVQAFADADLIARLPNRVLATPNAPMLADLPDPFRVVRSTPLEDLGVTLAPAGAVTMPDAFVSMTVGPDGMLYVIDAASVVSVIDPATAAVVRRFGRHGAAEGEFGCFCAIAVAPDGRLYVLEMGNNRIQVLDTDGTYLRQLGSFGEAEGQFVSPIHLAVDASGSVYVLEGPNGLISKFDSEGGFVWRVGGPSADPRLASAFDLAVMKDGTILVTLEPGGPALLLDPDDGSILGTWGDESVGFSASPVVGPAGNVFLFQYGPPNIQGGSPAMRMFDPAGRPLGIRDLKDTPPGPERFFPTPVFAPDGYGYSFGGSQGGLVRIEITLP